MQPPHECNKMIPEALSNFVMECVRTNPAKRPEDMTVVLRRLELLHHAVKKAVQRLRERYRQHLRSEIAQTVSSPDQIDEEISHLFAAVRT